MGCYSDFSSRSPVTLRRDYERGLPWPGFCDAAVPVLSGKQAVKATASKTSQSVRNPQFELLIKDIALSKFITCSRDCGLTSTKEPVRKHYALELGLRTVERQLSGCLFIFPDHQLDAAKLCLRA